VSDDVRRWSDELARDPSSLVFLQLGEALRRRGDLELARKVALRGLERHPHHADAHDLLARVAADHGEMERAGDEWAMALRIAPGHAGALKGLGFLSYADGRLEEAARYLADAATADATDPRIAAALAHVQQELRERYAPAAGGDGAARRLPRDPRFAFVDVIGGGEQAALLLDSTGLVLAGTYPVADGEDVGGEVGAELSGVSDEARRAMRHLGLGAWQGIVVETDEATVAMAPAPADGVVLVAAHRETPLGFVRRLLARVAERAARWVEEGA
jgi:predicted regulator of Ras-like GTPase activity (Roadblock/LC7/MglB family)